MSFRESSLDRLEVTDEPFLEQWRLDSLGYDPKRGGSRIVCVLTAPDSRNVTRGVPRGAEPRPGICGALPPKPGTAPS
jgi:hypothetical protein